MKIIMDNYNLLSQMGFLDAEVLQSESINRVVADSDNAISLLKKRGRPRKFDLTYEDMLK